MTKRTPNVGTVGHIDHMSNDIVEIAAIDQLTRSYMVNPPVRLRPEQPWYRRFERKRRR